MKTFLFFISVVLAGSVHAQQCLPDGSVAFPSPPPPTFPPPTGQHSNPVSRSGPSYKIPFDTVLFNSTLGSKGGFNVVICEDGVTDDADIAAADNYVDSVIMRWLLTPHYAHRFNYINLYRIAKYSEQQGATNGYGKGDTLVHNRYGSTFDAYGLARLVIPENVDTFFADVTQYVPNYNLAINLVYDGNYGGSGWDLYDGRKVASFGIDIQSGWHLGDEVITHEMQHIMPFAGHSYLGDEYEDSFYCSIYDTIPLSYKDSPNFTSDTVNGRKWQDWINAGKPGIGFYDSAGICAGNYRPTELCAMRQVYLIVDNNTNIIGMPPFCPVCQENSTAYFDSVINPVYFTSPSPQSYSGSYTYHVMVDTPLVNTLRYQWLLDDSLIALGVDSVNINFNNLSNTANHTLQFVCTDTDKVILDTTLRRPWTTTWQLLTSVATGITTLDDNGFHIFPNPVTSQLNGTIQQLAPNTFIQILTPEGRIAIPNTPVTQNSFSIPVSSLPQGIYFVQLQNEEQKMVERVVKE